MTSVKEYIDEKIKDKYIRYFEYEEFSPTGKIDGGSFERLVVFKSYVDKNSIIKEDKLNKFNNELVTFFLYCAVY